MLKCQQLILSMKLITDNFEYALENANRPKPTEIHVIHINRSRQKYYLATKHLGNSHSSLTVTNANWGNLFLLVV